MKGWRPDLSPTQQELFDCPAINILAYGEKGSDKGIGGFRRCTSYKLPRLPISEAIHIS